ncbi:MAG: hypothetical protein JXQ75_22715 [Phycisphaerae bacterium]|nr:hypothetical protein [Phycisphaerae bacterium]
MSRPLTTGRFVLAAVAALLLVEPRVGRASGVVIPRMDSPIVFTQIPTGRDIEKQAPLVGGVLRADYGEGGRIVRLDPDGQLWELTEGFSSACGLDVSFDGQRILFAARRGPQDLWNIWEMGSDGSGVRQITKDLGNCRSPAYQATLYTIVSTEPWYQIMFVSDAAGMMNEHGTGAATSLYSCKLDGSAVRRLTMNLSGDVDPFLMDDGRVLLAGWQRMDLRRGLLGRVALFGVNTDGADYALVCGDQGRRIKHMPCVTTDGLVVFVEADSVPWDGAGQLASVALRRNLYSHRSITDDPVMLYHSPSPLRDGAVLVSCRPADGTSPTGETPVPQEMSTGETPVPQEMSAGGTLVPQEMSTGGMPGPQGPNKTHGIYRLDPRTGRKQLIFDDPRFHDIHAKVLTPRPQPDGRSSVVNEKYPTGILYCLNAYLTDPAVMSHMKPGMIRGLRVIEGVPPSVDDPAVRSPDDTTVGFGGPATVNGLVPVVQRRLLGQVLVEEDGSFQIELPADVPVQLQTLDENGMALRSCGWIWVKHREPRGCIGCHEDPELTPENWFVQAVRRPAMKLTLPAEKRRTVDFRRDVMPIIAEKCASCHTGEEGGLDLRAERQGLFNRAYVSLLAVFATPVAKDKPVVGMYVQPGQARSSPLIWRIFGRNTSRPWDKSYKPGQTFPVMPPPSAASQLTDDEKLSFTEWIDLGAHWDGIPGPDELTAASEHGTDTVRRRDKNGGEE